MSKQPTKGELMPLEGPGRHNGRLHPKTEKVSDAKQMPVSKLRAARAKKEHLETRS